VKPPPAVERRSGWIPRSSTNELPHARGRLAAGFLGGGTEPDPRFSLANERTFLAWIRTSLAFIAGGIAVEAFTHTRFEADFRQSLAAVLLGLGMIISAGAAFRWFKVERAMRQGRPLPMPLLIPVLSAFGVAAAVILVIVTIWR
jgi:putative membrane protein